MSFLALSGLVNLITSSILGIIYLVRIPRKDLRNTAFLANVSISIFSFGYLFWQMSDNIPDAIFWFKILVVGIILINAVFIHFVLVFLGLAKKYSYILIINYFFSLLFIYFNFTFQFFETLQPRYNLGFWPVPKTFFHIYLAFWWIQCVCGFGMLMSGLKKTSGYQREQIRYFAFGLGAAFAGGASNWPMWYSIHFPPYLNILISVYVGFASYAIIKYKLMNISIVLTRTGIFLILYTLILGFPLFYGYHKGFTIISFLILFVLASTGPWIYQILLRKIDNVLLANQRLYQKMFLQAGREFMRERDINIITRIIITGLENHIKVTFAAFFLIDREANGFRLKDYCGELNIPRETLISSNNSLISMITEKRKILTAQELDGIDHNKLMTGTQIIIPSFLDNELLAFLVMGEKKDRSSFNNEDIYTFEIIAHQTALAIENCLYLNEREKVRERLFQAEKSAFIAGIAEGVAHQINNRLNQFSFTSAELAITGKELENILPAEMKKNDDIIEIFDQLKHIKEQIIENVKRTNDVIKGVLNYANLVKRDDYPSEFFFNEIVEAAIDLAKVKHEFDEVKIDVQITGTSNMIYGKMTQILESMYILIDNAYDAIDEKIRYLQSNSSNSIFKDPSILIHLIQDNKTSRIEITDNGIGIKEEDVSKIFAPYFTTKSSTKENNGNGIGLYEVSRFVQEHHSGKISFITQYMKGTTFIIELPGNPEHSSIA